MNTQIFSAVVGLAAIGSFSIATADEPAKTADCTFLIRVDRKIVEPPAQNVTQRGKVNHVIVGTHALGTSATAGSMRMLLDERSEIPTLNITFSGVTNTYTNGTNGPATVKSRSATKFQCSRRVVFTLDKGFVAEPAIVKTATTVSVDNISANLPGLRGRLVERIAQRRSEETQSEVVAEADRLTRADIRLGFEKGVDEYLTDLNKQFSTARQLAMLSGKNSALQMKVVGENRDSILLYLACDDGCELKFPELGDRQADTEVWLKTPKLPTTTVVPASMTALLTQQLPGVGSVLAMAPLFKLPSPADGETIGCCTKDEWTIITINEAVAESIRHAKANAEANAQAAVARPTTTAADIRPSLVVAADSN